MARVLKIPPEDIHEQDVNIFMEFCKTGVTPDDRLTMKQVILGVLYGQNVEGDGSQSPEQNQYPKCKYF